MGTSKPNMQDYISSLHRAQYLKKNGQCALSPLQGDAVASPPAREGGYFPIGSPIKLPHGHRRQTTQIHRQSQIHPARHSCHIASLFLYQLGGLIPSLILRICRRCTKAPPKLNWQVRLRASQPYQPVSPLPPKKECRQLLYQCPLVSTTVSAGRKDICLIQEDNTDLSQYLHYPPGPPLITSWWQTSNSWLTKE